MASTLTYLERFVLIDNSFNCILVNYLNITVNKFVVVCKDVIFNKNK